jgi:hypothetical protein
MRAIPWLSLCGDQRNRNAKACLGRFTGVELLLNVRWGSRGDAFPFGVPLSSPAASPDQTGRVHNYSFLTPSLPVPCSDPKTSFSSFSGF